MTELEEQSAVWAGDPERIDPDDYPPSRPYARQITWAWCETCGIQVHQAVGQFLYHGISCPRCGQRLLEPPEEVLEWVRRVLREEDELSEQL